MKNLSFILVFSIILLTYLAVNYYLCRRARQALVSLPKLRRIMTILIIFLTLSYFAGRLMERLFPSFIGMVFVWLGAFWMAAMLYSLLFTILIDFIRLIHRIIPFYPGWLTRNLSKTKIAVFGCIAGITALIVFTGYINAITLRVKELQIIVKNKRTPLEKLKITLVSDIHLGKINGRRRLNSIVETVNRQQPDVILLAGDIIDDEVSSFYRQNLHQILRKFQARYGVYGVTGNHEYIAGVDATVKAMEAGGIRVLQNEAAKIAGSIYVAGRNDWVSSRSEGKPRKALAEILSGIDKRLPVILMDHTPFNLEEASKNEVDLQVSGHTHYGQLWPVNYIIRMIYELSWGYMKKGNTHYYVSCGAGTWGPPVRTGSHSEIVNINIRFQ